MLGRNRVVGRSGPLRHAGTQSGQHETEDEKVPFFETVMKVSEDLLPSRVYASRVSASKTTRYFVGRFPIFVKKTPSCSPLIAFTYVDEGAPSLKGLSTHLEAYRDMLQSLPGFEFLSFRSLVQGSGRGVLPHCPGAVCRQFG